MLAKHTRTTNIRRAVIQHLAGHPGATSISIAEALGHNPTGVSGVLSRMHDHGMVARQRAGRQFHYILRAGWDEGSTDEVPGTALQVAELHAKIAELEAWKANAVEQYPELGAEDYEPYRAVLQRFYDIELSGWQAAEGELDDTDINFVRAILATADAFLAVRDYLKDCD